eukprot:scaffold103550_cov20-Tisochrysis_lutea.AAC.2
MRVPGSCLSGAAGVHGCRAPHGVVPAAARGVQPAAAAAPVQQQPCVPGSAAPAVGRLSHSGGGGAGGVRGAGWGQPAARSGHLSGSAVRCVVAAPIPLCKP